MGLYHSGGIDWSFDNTRLTGLDRDLSVLQADPYSNYLKAQWLELIDSYKPAILWNDITYPRRQDVPKIIAHYYNTVPDGLVNNRWGVRFHDFTTPEYAKYDHVVRKKWESCRGIGYSFGYNAVETDEHMLSEEDLIELLVDIVSKNGNLLLNVGPKADGSVSDLQLRRLKALGQWLKTNGEAIYKTRPWKTAEGKTTDDIEVRFTQKPDALYAILLQKPAGNNVTIKSLIVAPKTKIRLLGSKQNITWQQHETDLLIHLPENLPARYAYALKITPAPHQRTPE